MKVIVNLIINTLGVFLTAWILEPNVSVNHFSTALIVALVLSLLNITVKPLLFVLTLPATILSFGLFIFIINAIVIQIASHLVSGFHVQNIGWALLFSLILSVINSVLFSIGDKPQPPNFN